MPVTDLRRDEFQILEERVEQKIEQFEPVVIRGVGQSGSRADPRTLIAFRVVP